MFAIYFFLKATDYCLKKLYIDSDCSAKREAKWHKTDHRPEVRVGVGEGARNPLRKADNYGPETGKGRRRENSERVEW